MKKPIGYISYTHGLDGKVKIVPMIEPDEFQNIVANSLSGEAQKIFFQEDDKYNNINIFISAFNGKSFICKINNIENIEDVKSFLKKEIFIDAEDDDYIDPEKLIGFVAFDYKTKQEIGNVVDFGDHGGGMLIEIEIVNLNAEKMVKKNTKSEFYLCNRDFIKKIDVNRKMIFINKYNFVN